MEKCKMGIKNTLLTKTGQKRGKQLCRNAHINELDNSWLGSKLLGHEFFRIGFYNLVINPFVNLCRKNSR